MACKSSWQLLAVAALCLVSFGCSGDGGEQPQEPVAPAPEETPYPEDPDMAPKEGDAAPQPKEDIPDGVGELTADPFEGKQSPDDPIAESTPNDDLPPPDEGDSVGDALQGNEPNYQASPGTAPDVPGGVGEPKAKAPKAAKAGKGKQQRYVDAVMLNVRSKPSRNAPVVRRLLGGAMIHVELKGKWAKIKDGQWVRTRFLSATPTKKVSRAEADKAWHNANKKTAAKKGKGAKTKPKKSAKAKAKAVEPVAPAEPDPAEPLETEPTPPEETPATDG